MFLERGQVPQGLGAADARCPRPAGQAACGSPRPASARGRAPAVSPGATECPGRGGCAESPRAGRGCLPGMGVGAGHRTRALHGAETSFGPQGRRTPHPAAPRCCAGERVGLTGERGAGSCFLLCFFSGAGKGRSECAASEASPLWPLGLQKGFCLESSSLPPAARLRAWGLRTLPSRRAPPSALQPLPRRTGRAGLPRGAWGAGGGPSAERAGPAGWEGGREAFYSNARGCQAPPPALAACGATEFSLTRWWKSPQP